MPLHHVWFSTKRRKWLLQGEVLDAAREQFKEIADREGIKLIEYEAIVDHVHMLLDVDDKAELSRAMNYLKGASARALFLEFPMLKLDAHTNSFWQNGYRSNVVPPEAAEDVRHYIRTQWDRLEKYER